jgi:phage protein D
MKAEEPVDIVVQRDQHGIDFLASRARRLGYIVALREGNPGAKTAAERVPHVYFGPSHGRAARASTESIELTWGSSLIEFSSRISSSTQVKSVTVNGVRLARGKPVTATATLGDLGIPLTPSARRMSASWDSAESFAIDAPVRTQRDATRLAKAILGDRIKDIETASGICVGLPDLRAGKRVVIEGVGKPFGGSCLVTNSTHTIDESGYETSFSARREQKGDLIRTR